MRILREDYTIDEVEQRINDTRNIIHALKDSLSLLQSVAEESALSKEKIDDITISARALAVDVEDMLDAFSLEFDNILSEEEDEFEEEDFEEEEIEDV